MPPFHREPYDLIGVGFGPANIGLAVAMEESGWEGSALFLERRAGPDWQPGMLLDGADIQHHPLRDFATPRNPLSPYSFLHFLKLHDRLFQFLNLDIAFPLRKDYAAYIRWVANCFDRWTRYRAEVRDIGFEANGNATAPLVTVRLANGELIRARTLSFAPGRSPAVPPVFQPLLGERVVHFTDYLPSLAQWRSEGRVNSICVIGGSQSAIEVTLDLSRCHPPFQIHNIHRGFGYQLKDTSPFTEEIYFPGFVDTFYNSNGRRQQQLWQELRRSNYGSADHDVIQQLYCRLYEQRLDGEARIALHTNCEVVGAERRDGEISLMLRDLHGAGVHELCVDAVVLATGFKNFGGGENEEPYHPLLKRIAPLASHRASGDISLSRDYRVRSLDGGQLLPIFLNGLCESSHGFGDAGSFSLLSLRSQMIANSLMEILGMRNRNTQAHSVEFNHIMAPLREEPADV